MRNRAKKPDLLVIEETIDKAPKGRHDFQERAKTADEPATSSVNVTTVRPSDERSKREESASKPLATFVDHD